MKGHPRLHEFVSAPYRIGVAAETNFKDQGDGMDEHDRYIMQRMRG